jgi:hypothetical protein
MKICQAVQTLLVGDTPTERLVTLKSLGEMSFWKNKELEGKY